MTDASPSLFERLRRYRTTPGRDATEDRLTEGLAATLQAAPAAAAAIAHAFFGDVGDLAGQPVEIATQVGAAGLELVDLQLLFGAGTPDELRVWIEVKDRSPAAREQGERYMDHLRTTTVRGTWRFGWLLRPGSHVAGGAPSPARLHSWQNLAEILAAWATAQPDTSSFAVGMVREYVKHLEELSMAHLSPLTARGAAALNWHEEAQQAARRVFEDARAMLERDWGVPGDNSFISDPLHFHAHYPMARAGQPVRWPADGPWFEWRGRRDYLRAPERRIGQIVIGAGAGFVAQDAPHMGHPSQWLEGLLDAGFEYGCERGRLWFLMRYWTLEELAQQESISGQAGWLAARVTETFAELAENPPPPGVVPPAR